MIPPTPTPTTAPPPRALGWLLAVPALLGTVLTLVIPTIQTVSMSFQTGDFMHPSRFVGMKNYSSLLADQVFWTSAGFTLSLVVVPLLVSVVVAPLVALGLAFGGSWVRRAGMTVLTLALVTFSPVAVAAAWLQGLLPDSSGILALAAGLRDPATAPGALRLVVAAATFGAVCAIAVMAYLPALRGRTPGVAAIAVGALVALAAVAVAFQSFAFAFTLTRGGPSHTTTTLAILQYEGAFQRAQLGYGAAVATVLGILLGVLGLAATLVAVLTRLRLTVAADAPAPHDPPPGDPTPRNAPVPVPPGASVPLPQGAPAPGGAPGPVPGAPGFPGTVGGPSGQASGAGIAVGVIAVVLVTAVVVLCSWPALGSLFSPSERAGDYGVQLTTWWPAVAGAVVSVGVAYLAALGIGGLRPLGKGSEWLLLAFAPWLFVGMGPLSIADWRLVRNLGLLDSAPALIPPILVSIPALFVLTLLCKGLAERGTGDFLRGVLLPSLPMAAVLAGAVALMNAQELLWPLLAEQDPSLATAPVELVREIGQFLRPGSGLGAAPVTVVVLTALVAVAAQFLYLDRLRITAGRTTDG
ncbi:carbohydrate ABC transporter permease [Nonomuraea sediminis]|uniref:carbohydrate ABC transporter permease n=1 Tax=Nonomuraea sediminis TaxID=2835864 RepID=UPI001BDD0CCE|nr:hypothetical protein [Nonomuraea sediminis]